MRTLVHALVHGVRPEVLAAPPMLPKVRIYSGWTPTQKKIMMLADEGHSSENIAWMLMQESGQKVHRGDVELAMRVCRDQLVVVV